MPPGYEHFSSEDLFSLLDLKTDDTEIKYSRMLYALKSLTFLAKTDVDQFLDKLVIAGLLCQKLQVLIGTESVATKPNYELRTAHALLKCYLLGIDVETAHSVFSLDSKV